MPSTRNQAPEHARDGIRAGGPPGRVSAEAFVWRPDGESPAAPDVQAGLRELHHDLRQPLATVRALVFAAQSDPDLSEVVATCLARIHDEADRMLELCRHVLQERGEWRPVRLDRLADEVASGCELATGRRVDVRAEPVEVVVDEVELRRALVNLLDNAARAAGSGGRVCLEVRRGRDHVRITVEDSGPGFAVGVPGTASLGLAIVSGAAGRLGARLELEESALGGAMVSLVLAAGA